MEKSDYWIAINGHMAIDKLFFDRDYWMYFVLIPGEFGCYDKSFTIYLWSTKTF